MTPEQENQLFKSIGQIEATQASILNEVRQIKTDVNARVDKLEVRVEKAEKQLTNTRLKIAGASGLTGVAAAITSELMKLGGG